MESENTWRAALVNGLWSGTFASLVSTAVLACCGSAERNDAFRPLNGPSQWIWGKQAPYARGFSLRHTVVGFLIHHAMSIFWAVGFEKLRGCAKDRDAGPACMSAAAATSAAACLVDYRLIPKRLTPGFEKQLTRTSLLATYAAFALALAGAVWVKRR
jgi:hypothetical protein